MGTRATASPNTRCLDCPSPPMRAAPEDRVPILGCKCPHGGGWTSPRPALSLGPIPIDSLGELLNMKVIAQETILVICVGLADMASSRKDLRDNNSDLSLTDSPFSSEETKK